MVSICKGCAVWCSCLYVWLILCMFDSFDSADVPVGLSWSDSKLKHFTASGNLIWFDLLLELKQRYLAILAIRNFWRCTEADMTSPCQSFPFPQWLQAVVLKPFSSTGHFIVHPTFACCITLAWQNQYEYAVLTTTCFLNHQATKISLCWLSLLLVL